MGNIIATITWDDYFDNNLIKDKLSRLASSSGLSIGTDPNYAYNNVTLQCNNYFIADISGIFLAWNRAGQKSKVEKFAEDAMHVLKTMGVSNPHSMVEDLAM